MAFYTPEESRLRHIAQVMEWQKRNPEKHKSYVEKYNRKPEVRAKRREADRLRYHEQKKLKELENITTNKEK